MISFSEYKCLEQSKQAEILWMEGVYLELVRRTRKMNIELYSLNDFYVEIFFDRITEEPLFLKSFKNIRSLDAYLSLIDIENALVLI